MKTLSVLALLLLSAVAHAQAEPAPPGYQPPAHQGAPIYTPPPAPGPLWRIAVYPRLALRIGEAPGELPRVGYGGGVQVARALKAIGRARVGLGFDFAYDRFQHNGQPISPFISTAQYLSHTSFAALVILDGLFGRVRPWIGAGGGFSVGTYQNPPDTTGVMLVSQTEVVPLVQGAAGLGVEIVNGIAVGLHGEVNLTFSSETSGAPPRQLFSPGFGALGLDLGFRI